MLKKIIDELNKNKQVVVKLKIKANAPKNEITGVLADGSVKIAVAAQPEKGKANKELIKFLASTFDISKTHHCQIDSVNQLFFSNFY